MGGIFVPANPNRSMPVAPKDAARPAWLRRISRLRTPSPDWANAADRNGSIFAETSRQRADTSRQRGRIFALSTNP
jgi:hypothetical protein